MTTSDTTSATVDVHQLILELQRKNAATGARQLIGIAGAPGTGKSTFADHVAAELGAENCIVVPMDGFHLGNAIIDGTELQNRKGAIDTFDVGGYLSLLGRLKARTEPVVYAPSYRRGLEEPIAASIAIPASTPFILTEGNYLLSDEQPWNLVRELLDEAWFVETPQQLRLARLIERHIAFGKTREQATEWALCPDEANARYIDTTKHSATRIIAWA
ncbi:MAG: nucleoside/nucleotide kinase family protein [Microbacterium sp.]